MTKSFSHMSNALNDNYYSNNLKNTVKNILGGQQTIKVSDLEKISVFQNLNKILNSTGKARLEQIANFDGDKNTLNREELTALLLLLDCEINNDELEYDGNISINKNNRINSATSSVIKLLQNFAAKLYDFDNNKQQNICIDKVIGNSMQVQGNCWFLTELNGLRETTFGQNIISDSIIDNKDTTYTVLFKGDNKSYTFTRQDLLNAKISFNHVIGDDDVLLLEMAFGKFYLEADADRYSKNRKDIRQDDDRNYIVKIFEKDIKLSQDELKNIDTSDIDAIIRTAYIKSENSEEMCGAYTLTDEFDILTHLCGKSYFYDLTDWEDNNQDKQKIKKALKLMADNKQNLAIFFNSSFDIESDLSTEFNFGSGSHVYCIKDVILNSKGKIKSVGIVNPYDSSETIYKSFNEFFKVAKFINPFDKDDSYYDFYYATDNKEIQNSLKVED